MALHTFRRLINSALVLSATLFCILSVNALAQNNIPTGAVSDIRPSSVLFFAKYTSNPSNSQLGDTQINLTNTNQAGGRTNVQEVHLFFVDGTTCSVADSFAGLTPNGTVTFRASELDPGVTGYLIAVAVSGGAPTKFNYLIGDEFVREADGRVYNLPGIGFAKITPGEITQDPDGRWYMVFDGNEYEKMPATVAISSFNSQTTDNTQLNIFIPPSDLSIGGGPETTTLSGNIFDDLENAFSYSNINIACYRTVNLSAIRIPNGINNVIPAGRTGWMQIRGNGKPLLGAVTNRGPLFIGGHNLHAMTFLASYKVAVPVF